MNGRAAWGGAASPCLSNNSFQPGCCSPCWHLQSKLVAVWAGLSRLGQGTEALPGRLGSAPALAGTVGPSQALPRPPFAMSEVGCLCHRRGCRSPNPGVALPWHFWLSVQWPPESHLEQKWDVLGPVHSMWGAENSSES